MIDIFDQYYIYITKSNNMGSTYIKDQNIQIHLKLFKQFYTSGQQIEGEIYLRVRKPSQYTKLIVGIEGDEFIQWTNRQFNVRYTYRNKHQSYRSYFLVRDFNGKVDVGDYLFPFSCLLPAMMTGSFYHSNQCYIKYVIKAKLTSQIEPEKRSQISQKFLNILENPKKPQGPVTKSRAVKSECCGCCMDYGIVSATLNCDKNFVTNGDQVQVTGCLDNTRGKKTVEGRLVLERIRFKVSSGGEMRRKIQQSYNFNFLHTALPGISTDFTATIKIPDSLSRCTAIGRFLANYYLLHLYTNYGCCASKPQPQIHLVVHSKTPMILKSDPVPEIPNWSPQVKPRIVCNNLNPFNYMPDPNLPGQIQQPIHVMNTTVSKPVSKPKPQQMSPVKQTKPNNSKAKTKAKAPPKKAANTGQKPVFKEEKEEEMNETNRQINQQVLVQEVVRPMKEVE